MFFWRSEKRESKGQTDPILRDYLGDGMADIRDSKENRQWWEIEEFKGIPELAQSPSYQARQDTYASLQKLLRKYEDFYFVYYWMANIRVEDFDAGGGRHNAFLLGQAKEILKNGLEKAKLKHPLCELLTWIESTHGSFPDAVKLWIASILAQMNSGKLVSFEPFFYLSYVAADLGDQVSSDLLLAQSDALDHRKLRLDANGCDKLFRKVHSYGDDQMKEVIAILSKAITEKGQA